MALTIKLLGGAALAYLLFALALWSLQRKLIYAPSGGYVSPARVGLEGVREKVFHSPDGAKFLAWYAPPASDRPTVLYFHGNAGGLAHRAERIATYQDAGYGMLMVSYRGYSGGTGQPSEKAIIQDSLMAFDWLQQTHKPRRIFVHGVSLGTGVAVQVAAQRPVAGLILEAPYTSLPDVGQYHYPFLPVKYFMFDRFDSLAFIPQVRAPVLILHGEADQVIPVALGKRLLAAANEPKTGIFPRHAGHNDLFAHGAFAHIEDMLRRESQSPRP